MKPLYGIALASFVILSIGLTAQNTHLKCDHSHYTDLYHQNHPEEFQDAMSAHEWLNNYTRTYTENEAERSNVLIIPVVFHIIHAGGNENISNAQIQSAIDVLNEDFSASTPGVQNVVAQFASIVGDVGFEFRLARKDPNGNCTNGIVRTFNSATFEGGENLKTISPIWNRSRYLNIWVCSSISGGAAGYAYLPGDMNGGIGLSVDGIVIQHNYVGRIGTSNATLSHALSHEVGHWANLLHTWGISNSPGLASNCNGDDGVADTPNTIGWSTCNLNGSTCSSLDNVENFMDYAYCYKMFTQGQRTRMRAALNSPVAQRNNLHSSANLTFTGVNQPDVVCHADFDVSGSKSVCVGQPVTFTDMSYNGVDTYNWSFPGGTPSTSTAANPEVSYSAPGVYSVTLTASNDISSATATKQAFVRVLPQAENAIPYAEGFESFASLEPNSQNWSVVNPDEGSIRWELNSNVGYDGSKSVYVQGRSNIDNAVEILDSPTYDLSNVSSNAVLRFKYAHARRNTQSDDRLRIYISRNCGEQWSLRRTISMNTLPTVPQSVLGQFVPTSQSDWAEVEISNIVSVFLTNEFRVRFEFKSYRGNNIYIDNINLFDPATVSVPEIDFLNGLNVFPNPAKHETSLAFHLERSTNMNIELLDMTGRPVRSIASGFRAAGEHLEQIPVVDLANGVYLIQIKSDEGQVVRRVVVNK